MPHHPTAPPGGPVGAAAPVSAATRCQHQCSRSKRSPVELSDAPEKAPAGLRRLTTLHGDMDQTALDADLVALVVQLNTRIGMIMEDVSLAALDATSEGLKARVQAIAAASGRITALVGASQALLTE